MAKSNSNSQIAKTKSSRPYKSRSQRPCDFCRRRKTCCIIEGSIPCTPCIQFNQSKCTFNEGPMKRNNKQDKSNAYLVATASASAASPPATALATAGTQKIAKKQSKPILSKAAYITPPNPMPTSPTVYSKIGKKPISSKPKKQTTPQLKSQSLPSTSTSSHFTSTIAYPPILSHQPSLPTPPTTTTLPSSTNSKQYKSYSHQTSVINNLQSNNQISSPVSAVSLDALDLINDYTEFEPLTSELSSLLTSRTTEDEEKRRTLAGLSKLSHTIFNVISSSQAGMNNNNTTTTTTNNNDNINMKPSTINPTRDLEVQTSSSEYSSNNLSPYRMESLTSVESSGVYNYQVMPSPLMVQPLDLQSRFEDEYQKLQPDLSFEEYFPMFQFSPESDVF